MEDYGIVFDAEAIPRIPPEFSVSMPIWGQAVPAQPIDGYPVIQSSSPPIQLADPTTLLEQAGCEVIDAYNEVTCPPQSALSAFGCESIYPPTGIYPDLGPDRALVATCYATPPGKAPPTENDLFQRGCAFRVNAAHIFKVGDEYVQVGSPQALQAFFSPIESPEQALSYAQLRTGLVAQFDFEIDRSMIYFTDTLAGTQVTLSEDGYRVNLFHYQYCFCEPYVNSQVELRVDETGEVNWLKAVPFSMTTGFGCTD